MVRRMLVEEVNCGFTTESIKIVMSDMTNEVVMDKEVYDEFRQTKTDEELFGFLTME